MSEIPLNIDVVQKVNEDQSRPSSSRFEVPEEYQHLVPLVAQHIADNQELLFAIAGDRSLKFKPAMGFFIDLKSGEVGIGVGDWHWAQTAGIPQEDFEDTIVWSECHEIGHFYDLKQNPQEVLSQFEHMKRRARELAPRALEIWRQRSGGNLPDYLTNEVIVNSTTGEKMPFVEIFLYKELSSFYNSLGDMYVNYDLQRRSASFRAGSGSRAPIVERLYRDYLFPTDPQRRWSPPRELEAADYRGLPGSHQFHEYLLRRRMVPNQPILISDEVRARLNGFADSVAQRFNRTVEMAADAITDPGKVEQSKNPGWRYARIRQAIEPAFVDLLMQDLEKMPIPPEPKKVEDAQQKAQAKKAEEEYAQANPWGHHNEKPESINIEAVKNFIKQQKEKAKEEAKKKKQEEADRRLTPDQRLKKAQAQTDRIICEKFRIDPAFAEKYRMLEESVLPYKGELASVFEELMNNLSTQIEQYWLEGFKKGRFNIETLIRKYGAEIASERIELITPEEWFVHDQREFISRLSLYPDRIRVRFIIDGTGSMSEERILAAKQLFVLFVEGLTSFEASINLRYRLLKPIYVDTEVRMFGDPGKSVVVKPFRGAKPTVEEEKASRFAALSNMHNGYGSTCDAEPWWAVAVSIDQALEADLKAGKAKEFVSEITDGGSNVASSFALDGVTPAQDTRNAVNAVENKGVICRGLQTGTPNEEEKETFSAIWGQNGALVPEASKLAQTMIRLWKDEIAKTQFQVQYVEEIAG